MEIAKSVKNNPIMQDTTKDEKPRYYDGPIFWNYGYFPQTWESPYVVNEHLNLRGDKYVCLWYLVLQYLIKVVRLLRHQ